MKKTVLKTVNINKYFNDPVKIHVLKNLSINISLGDFTSIIGSSGCGKSTLLYILSTMDTDYTGQLLIDGVDMSGKSDVELAAIRNKKIGFVFQFHYLLNEFSVLKNVMLPGYKLNRVHEQELEHKAYELIKKLGIEKQALKMAHQLSGGEKQRVAIARSLINDPVIIMCDEPTGNLDSINTALVFDIFKELTETFNKTLLVVTHDLDFAKNTKNIIRMDDGKIVNSA